MSNKVRNRLLALGCLLVFLGLGALFYVNWVVQRPFAVILFLADNLTPSVLTPARNYQGGADHRLTLEKLPHLALVSTHANDFAVADGAAAATSIATGKKGNNGAVGVPAAKGMSPTLLGIARERGRSVGIVSSASVTDATPAAFYAGTPDALDHAGIALQLAESGSIDVVLGGGGADLLPREKGGQRSDGRDLIGEMGGRGYDIVRTEVELEGLPLWRSPRTLGIFSMGNLNFANEPVGDTGQPSLASMVRNAIRLLQYNPRGYFMVVDAGLAARSGSQNEGERTLREILSLDEAVAEALAYAGEDALVVVVGKRNVGGLRLNASPFRNDKGAALLGINTQGVPSITWSTGPESGTRMAPEGPVSTEPAASKRAAGVGTAEDAVAVGTGPGAEALRGFKDNTDIFKVLEKSL